MFSGQMWLWVLATVCAFYIKGLCGFANTLIFTSILGFGANNINISPIELVLGYPTNIIIAVKNRKKLDLKVVITLVALVLIGSVPGAILLKNVQANYLKVVFGVVIVLVGIEMLLREKGHNTIKESNVLLVTIGVISGVLCGIFGVGVLLAAYVTRITKTNDEFKANLCAVFAVENTFRIIEYAVLGVVTFGTIKQSIALVPFMLLSLFAGMKSSQVLDEKIARKLVIILLIISGLALVIMNI